MNYLFGEIVTIICNCVKEKAIKNRTFELDKNKK